MTTAEFIKSMRMHGLALPDQFNHWLQKLPTVQFQALVSAMLALGTGMWYWVTTAYERTIDTTNFIAWLAFVAAYGGIAYARPFAKKRETYDPIGKPSEQNKQEPVQ